jgi:hypothetical protein
MPPAAALSMPSHTTWPCCGLGDEAQLKIVTVLGERPGGLVGA